MSLSLKLNTTKSKSVFSRMLSSNKVGGKTKKYRCNNQRSDPNQWSDYNQKVIEINKQIRESNRKVRESNRKARESSKKIRESNRKLRNSNRKTQRK